MKSEDYLNDIRLSSFKPLKTLPKESKKILYMTLFNEGNKVLKAYNPCQIKDGTCAGSYKDDIGLCCNGCKHLGPLGCTVESLMCKLWLCQGIIQTPAGKSAILRLNQLHHVARASGVPLVMRSSFEASFNE